MYVCTVCVCEREVKKYKLKAELYSCVSVCFKLGVNILIA